MCSFGLWYYIEITIGESLFGTAIIHENINNVINNTTGEERLLQNILMEGNRSKVHHIGKIFVSSVLYTCNVSSNMVGKLILGIGIICKDKNVHFIDNNNILIN